MKKIIILGLLVLIGISHGQASDSINDSVTIDDLAWLAGHWEGEAFGSVCEEIWSRPSASTMVGTFKLFNDDKVIFYEIMILSVDSTGPHVTLKHFNPDLTGWEEKNDVVTFPFKNYSDNFLELEGISYHRFAVDSLLITVGTHMKDGTITEEKIKCHLKK